mmetsp:Transcript_32620/g.75039  ORF Transcript_32620/g.75039 Transcript_32620/m.75039 type:complete len:194 (+) Transcript_32620:1683-2264(+)
MTCHWLLVRLGVLITRTLTQLKGHCAEQCRKTAVRCSVDCKAIVNISPGFLTSVHCCLEVTIAGHCQYISFHFRPSAEQQCSCDLFNSKRPTLHKKGSLANFVSKRKPHTQGLLICIFVGDRYVGRRIWYVLTMSQKCQQAVGQSTLMTSRIRYVVPCQRPVVVCQTFPPSGKEPRTQTAPGCRVSRHHVFHS